MRDSCNDHAGSCNPQRWFRETGLPGAADEMVTDKKTKKFLVVETCGDTVG
jgi:hypothetical protein